MTQSVSVFRTRTEFDNFLFAPIDEDGNGMLSVLSALTQLDFDPWREATELTRLSADKATQRLATLIASLPNRAVDATGRRWHCRSPGRAFAAWNHNQYPDPGSCDAAGSAHPSNC